MAVPRRFFRRHLFSLSAIVLFLQGWPAQAALQIQFGVYSDEAVYRVVQTYRPLLDYLEKDLSQRMREQVTVSLRIFQDRQLLLDKLVTAELHMARLDPIPYLLGKKRESGLQLLVMENSEGKNQYNGIVVTHAQSDIETVSQFEGRRLAFGHPLASVEHYLFQSMLVDHQIRASSLAGFTNLEDARRVGYAVGARSYDGGAIDQYTYLQLINEGIALKPIATFAVDNAVWVAADINDYLVAYLRDTLLSVNDPALLKPLSRSQFNPIDDDALSASRRVIEQSKSFYR